MHLKNSGLLFPRVEPKPHHWGFLRLPFLFNTFVSEGWKRKTASSDLGCPF